MGNHILNTRAEVLIETCTARSDLRDQPLGNFNLQLCISGDSFVQGEAWRAEYVVVTKFETELNPLQVNTRAQVEKVISLTRALTLSKG